MRNERKFPYHFRIFNFQDLLTTNCSISQTKFLNKLTHFQIFTVKKVNTTRFGIGLTVKHQLLPSGFSRISLKLILFQLLTLTPAI